MHNKDLDINEMYLFVILELILQILKFIISEYTSVFKKFCKQ